MEAAQFGVSVYVNLMRLSDPQGKVNSSIQEAPDFPCSVHLPSSLLATQGSEDSIMPMQEQPNLCIGLDSTSC